jgi:hypothetical protein
MERFVCRTHRVILFPVVSVMQPPDPTPSLQPYYRAFIAVGSEEARLRADLRPPLKLQVQFSRVQLSRGLTLPGSKRGNQLNEVHQPVLAI